MFRLLARGTLSQTTTTTARKSFYQHTLRTMATTPDFVRVAGTAGMDHRRG